MKEVMHNFLGMVKSLYIVRACAKIKFALRRGLKEINPFCMTPDLFFKNRLSKKGPRRSGVKCGRGYIKRSKHIRTIGIATSSLLVLLTALAIFPITHHDDSAEATFVPATTTLSIVSSKNTASVDVTPISSTGTFATSSADNMAEFTVTTDNLTGYSVTLLGSDASGQLVNDTTGDTLDSITADTTENDFRTGSASTYNNKWGYRLNINNTTTTNFLSAPTSTSVAKTIYSTTGPNATGTSDSFTLGLGARIDYTKPTGTYTNTFIITAIANNISYQINYLDSDTTTTLLPSDAESDISASSIELNSTTPTKSGYEFKGWCDGTLSSDGTSCTGTPGTTYQPGDTYTFTTLSSTTSNIANLYAVWEHKIYMQDMDATQCTTTPMTVVDKRDNKEYTIARLADGQCWMTSNLNIAGGTALYSDDSNVDPANTRASGTPYYTLPASSTTGFDDDTKAYVYNTGNETTSQADCTSTQACNSYYSWLAATAGGKDASGTAVTGNGPDAAYSICPKGWRLPKSGNQSDTSATSTTGYKKGDFYKLATAYGANLESQNYQSSAVFYNNAGPGTLPNFLLAGEYYSSTFGLGGTYGRYWSSSSYSSTLAYALNFNSSAAQSAYDGYRRHGFPVRCALQPTMQNFTTQEAESMATGESRTLVDSRDGKSYTVAKLADGQIWMTQNLRYQGDTVGSTSTTTSWIMKSATSNISADTTMTMADLTAGNTYDAARYHVATSDQVPSGASYTAEDMGVWYNYAAASAMTITGSSNENAQVYDICPKGWRLPTNSEQSGITSQASAYSIVTGGRYDNGTLSLTGRGYWWSSTSNSTTNRYILYWDGSSLNTSYFSRLGGLYVRCVLNDSRTISDITTMQEINSQIVANTAEGTTATLKDIRDNNTYTVAKINGNLWMTQNLRYQGDTVGSTSTTTSWIMKSATSNISADKTMTMTDLTAGSTYDAARYHVPTSAQIPSGLTADDIGVWYNYAAASAMTITGSSNTNAQVYDICPKGWRLPTNTEQSGIISYASAYSPVVGGLYYNGALYYTGHGYWWSSTSYSTTNRYLLHWGSSLGTYDDTRDDGYYVRCVAQ